MVDAWGGWCLFQALLRTLKKVSSKHGVSIPTVAMRYILDQVRIQVFNIESQFSRVYRRNEMVLTWFSKHFALVISWVMKFFYYSGSCSRIADWCKIRPFRAHPGRERDILTCVGWRRCGDHQRGFCWRERSNGSNWWLWWRISADIDSSNTHLIWRRTQVLLKDMTWYFSTIIFYIKNNG